MWVRIPFYQEHESAQQEPEYQLPLPGPELAYWAENMMSAGN